MAFHLFLWKPGGYQKLTKMEDFNEKVEAFFSKHPSLIFARAHYQEGSVVSRTLVDKKTGTVTLFAFDERQGLSEHTTPFDALVYLLDGEAEIIISGKAHLLKKGEMIIMPANQPHALKAVKKFKMILIMIRS